MIDFRTTKEAVCDGIDVLNRNSEVWSWSAKVTKNEIKIYWTYFDYLDSKKKDHFTIRKGEQDDFIAAYNERDEFLNGAIIGYNGALSTCIYRLVKAVGRMANVLY